MSRTQSGDQDQPRELPDTVVHAPSTESLHRHGGDMEPACIDRQHHTDAEWRIASRLAVSGRPCQHPECFGGDQL